MTNNGKVHLARRWKCSIIIVSLMIAIGVVMDLFVYPLVTDRPSSMTNKGEGIEQNESSGILLSEDKILEQQEEEFHCDEAVQSMKSGDPMYNGEINRFRRYLALNHPTCFEKHWNWFAQMFIQRLHLQKHLSLHIPKTAGTTFCRMVKNYSNYTTFGKYCFSFGYCPLWCCCLRNQLSKSCQGLPWKNDERDGKPGYLPLFVMNENWLDHPLCSHEWFYSITIRNPVDRAISHINDLVRVSQDLIKPSRDKFNWRLNLGQSNYMTWSLISGYFSTTPQTMVPVSEEEREGGAHGIKPITAESIIPKVVTNTTAITATITKKSIIDHLSFAKETLSRFDMILEFSKNSACDAVIFEMLGLSQTEYLHSNVMNDSNYKKDFRRQDYVLLNRLDIQLYEYGTQLMNNDCDFFLRIYNESDWKQQRHAEKK